MMTFTKGACVAIVKGVYKKNGYGVYLGEHSNVVYTVRAEGDTKPSRKMWKTPIAKVKAATPQQEQEGVSGVVVIKRKQYEQLLEEINVLTEQLQQLKIKMKGLEELLIY